VSPLDNGVHWMCVISVALLLLTILPKRLGAVVGSKVPVHLFLLACSPCPGIRSLVDIVLAR
jgi:hypothetical protein